MLTTKGIVTDKKDGILFVLPLASESCMHCLQGDCNKRGVPLLVYAPKDFDAQIGERVVLGSKDKKSILQGIIAVILPILFAVAGYFVSQKFHSTEGVKALCVLICFFSSCAVITLINHKKPQMTNYQVIGLA